MGGGFHGGFGETEGSIRKNDIPIKSAEDIRFNKRKIE